MLVTLSPLFEANAGPAADTLAKMPSINEMTAKIETRRMPNPPCPKLRSAETSTLTLRGCRTRGHEGSSLIFWRDGPSTGQFGRKRPGQLVPGTHLQLSVNDAQLVLDGLGRHEQCLGDLLVGHPLGRHPRHACLGGRQRFWAEDPLAARAGTGRAQFVDGATRQMLGPTHVGEFEARGQRLSSRGPLVHSPQRGTQLDQRAGPLERCVGALDNGERLAQQVEACRAALDYA